MDDCDAEPRRTIGICDGCDRTAVVWVLPDGSVRSVSGHNVCPCTDASFRALEADDSAGDDR